MPLLVRSKTSASTICGGVEYITYSHQALTYPTQFCQLCAIGLYMENTSAVLEAWCCRMHLPRCEYGCGDDDCAPCRTVVRLVMLILCFSECQCDCRDVGTNSFRRVSTFTLVQRSSLRTSLMFGPCPEHPPCSTDFFSSSNQSLLHQPQLYVRLSMSRHTVWRGYVGRRSNLRDRQDEISGG